MKLALGAVQTRSSVTKVTQWRPVYDLDVFPAQGDPAFTLKAAQQADNNVAHSALFNIKMGSSRQIIRFCCYLFMTISR